MPERTSAAPHPADLAALAVALDRDSRRPDSERLAQDRRLAQDLGEPSADRGATALRWLEAACAEDAELAAARDRAQTTFALGQTLMVGLGLLSGWLGATAVFYYDGSGRVNVVAVLAVLVLVPALFLVPFILAALPPPVTRWVPGLGAGGRFFRGLGPGRLVPVLLRLLPGRWRETWQILGGRLSAQQAIYASVQKWLILRWSQAFALAFQGAALLAAAGLVFFTDLAFGWSTTLTSGDPAIDADRIHSFTSALAMPWAWAIDAAHPSLELIRDSRYYRAVDPTVSAAEAARLGQWWPFVLLALLGYGVLPRLATLILAHQRLQAASRVALHLTPGLTSLLGRLHRARIETSAPGAPTDRRTPAAPDPAEPALRQAPGDVATVLNWSAFPQDDETLARRFGATAVHHAGGASSIEADEAILTRLGKEPGEGPILIVVKAWEPPLLEFVDFVKTLRTRLPAGREIVVLPLALDEGEGPTPPAAASLAVWRRQLAKAQDPWLRVAAGDAPEVPS
ncbi:MAG: DUF2868 domain-containing protein [Opitutales bacterium]